MNKQRKEFKTSKTPYYFYVFRQHQVSTKEILKKNKKVKDLTQGNKIDTHGSSQTI